MVSLEQRISSLIRLGEWLSQYSGSLNFIVNEEFISLAEAVRNAHTYNPWLIEKYINNLIEKWATKLSNLSLSELIQKYPDIEREHYSHNIAVIPETNIPLAGLHDFISIILTGQRFYCRNLNHESEVLQVIAKKIVEFEPGLENSVYWCDHFPNDIDAYLIYLNSATEGTINEYFDKKPSIVRKRRVAVGVISDTDKESDYIKFADDIFNCFGHSNRNIRKLFVPEGFTVNKFYPAIEPYSYVYQYNRYANNFDYHRSVFLLERIQFYENGFLIMRESSELKVPTGCLNYEYYHSKEDLENKLKRDENEIQQIVTNARFIENAISPGESFEYSLFDFDDHKDVMGFLLKL